MTATPTPMPAHGLRPGDKLDKYEILEQIGAGGFSVVWKGYDRLLDQPVAIKQIMLDPGADMDLVRERFRNEAELQKRVASSNPHLVKLLAFIEEPRGMFIVMEFVQGMSLEQLMVSNPGPMELRMALGYAAAVAVALEAIHNEGIIHRDLKPSNILITHDGGLKVCDFGLATLVADQATPTVGTVRYMAPELLNSEPADARADIYSLGMILYELLVGRSNFNEAFKVVLRDQRNQSLRWMKWHTNSKINAPSIKQFNADVPETFVELVDRMMAKDAVRRIASAPQLIETMKRQLQGPQPGVAPGTGGAMAPNFAGAGGGMGLGDKTAALPKSRKVLYIVAATAAFWAIAAAVFFGMQNSAKNKKIRETQIAALNEYYRAAAIFERLNKDATVDQVKWSTYDATGTIVDDLKDRVESLDKSPTWTDINDTFGEVAKSIKDKSLTTLRVRANGDAALVIDAIDAHQTYCRAMIAFEASQFDDAITLFNEVDSTGVIDRDLVHDKTRSIQEQKNIARSYKIVEQRIAANDLIGAETEYKKFMSDAVRLLTDAQRDQWYQLENRIISKSQAKKITELMAKVTAQAAEDRAIAIESLEDWLSKNRDNPSRDVENYLKLLKGARDFEAAVAIGREAEGNEDYDAAIAGYQSAIALNATEAAKLLLPSRITTLRSQIAYNAGKAAFDEENYPIAVEKLREALSYDPDLSAAKALLKQIDSAGQMATLKKLAVAAFQNKEYAKSINLWKQLRDEFDYDADEAAVEIGKAEFLVKIDKMEKAWQSGDDKATILACDVVMAADPENERAALLKTLIETRRLFRSRMADGKEDFKNGDYGSSKRQILKAIKVAETVEDLAIRNALSSEANAFRDEVEYIDAMSKARRDFKLDRYRTAKGWIEVALNHKRTDEARELNEKIIKALKKQEAENG